MQKLTITSHNHLDDLVAQKVMDGIKSPYSLNIQSAWQVVEKIRENYQVNIYGKISQFTCEIIDMDQDERCSVDKSAFTAPLAICLCALASVGIEVKLEIPE